MRRDKKHLRSGVVVDTYRKSTHVINGCHRRTLPIHVYNDGLKNEKTNPNDSVSYTQHDTSLYTDMLCQGLICKHDTLLLT